MSHRVGISVVVLVTLIVAACEGTATDNRASANQQTEVVWGDRCDPEDRQLMQGTGALLSAQAYQSLLVSGLFVKEADVMTVSYREGYNLNFAISEEEARSLLPCNLTPMRLKLLESDPEPKYYLVMYMAVIDAEDDMLTTTRIDLFTYAWDEHGDRALHFVSSYMGVPDFIRDNAFLFDIFEEIFRFFARDSRTGEPAYPHYYADTLTIDHEAFALVHGTSRLEGTKCDPVTTGEAFTRDFVFANSQIYRSPIDKNVNFFNQSFSNAEVETRDLSCISHENLAGFHPLLKDLVSIHFYGSKDKKITWYYQTCVDSDCGNPFK